MEDVRRQFGDPVCYEYSVFLPMLDESNDDPPDTLTRWDKAVTKLWAMRTISNSINNSVESNSSTNKNETDSTPTDSWSFIGRLFGTKKDESTTHTSSEVTDNVTDGVIQETTTLNTTRYSVDNIMCETYETNTTSNETKCITDTISTIPYRKESVKPELGDFVIQEPNILNVSSENGTRVIHVPNLTLPVTEFDYIDSVVLLFFTCDFLLRMCSCPSIVRYFLSLVNLLDTCALIACYLYFVVISIYRQYRYLETTWVSLLNYVQIFRVFRLFRVVKNVRAAKVLAYSMTQNLTDITLLIMLLFVCISSFASVFYFVESRDTVPSIPTAWYWAVITMTTVGYGELRPHTGPGRVVASLCAIAGVFLLAIIMPLFVNKFLSLYRYSCVNRTMDKLKNRQYKQNNNTRTVRL